MATNNLARIFGAGGANSTKDTKKSDETYICMSAETPAQQLGPNCTTSSGRSSSLVVTEEIRMHDMFNIYCTGFIVLVDFTYLIYATEWNKFMTSELGAGHESLSKLLLASLTLYLTIDTVWIYVQPSCVLSGASALIAHHVAALLFCCIPYNEPRYAWHLAMNLAVEINTFALVARRNVSIHSTEYTILNALFYASWIFFRLFVFPALVLLYYAEYVEYTHSPEGGNGNPWNMVLLAPVLQGLLTLMGYKWTYDMLKKMTNKNGKIRSD